MVWFYLPFGLLLIFAFVILFGAPYLPTFNKQVSAAFAISKLKQGDSLVDLGSGDGRVLLAAAKRGIKATGYEINPILWLFSVIRTWPYRKLVTVKLKSFWSEELPETDVVFVFLIEHFMQKLDKKLTKELKPGTKVVSHAFKLPRQEMSRHEALFLYRF